MAICKGILQLWWLGKKLSQVTSLLRILFNYEHFRFDNFIPVLERK